MPHKVVQAYLKRTYKLKQSVCEPQSMCAPSRLFAVREETGLSRMGI